MVLEAVPNVPGTAGHASCASLGGAGRVAGPASAHDAWRVAGGWCPRVGGAPGGAPGGGIVFGRRVPGNCVLSTDATSRAAGRRFSAVIA